MATLPPLKRLVMEDYKTQQAWIGPLLLNLNGFFDAVINALNKSLTIAANSTGDMKSITLSSMPTAASPSQLTWTKPNRPVSVLVGNVTRQDGTPLVLTQAVQVQWQYVAPFLQITNVVGITPSSATPYVLQLTVHTG